jgi:NADH dehydrogenase/NADH:ubiquinone oxidoreductase subunit G
MRAAVLPQLPEKTRRTLTVEIDGATRRACDKLLATLAKAGIDLADAEALAKIHANGVAFTQMSAVRAALATAKIGPLVELVESFEEQDEPLVVFSAHRDPIDLLGKREGWAVVTGDTPNAERNAIEESFQRGELKGIAATIQAGGTAITLTRAAQSVFVDRAWTPALNDQAEDRIYRIGQTRGCVITTLVADHALDERVTELLGEKSRIIDASVVAAAVVTVPAAAPAVDFDALAAEAKAEAEKADKARAEAKKIAEERAKHFANENERKEAEKKEREAKAKAEKKQAAARARAAKRGLIAPQEEAADRHEARTARQQWAASAILQLTSDDPDYAATKNEMGFNKADGGNGHWLAEELQFGLTPKQWKLAVQLCAKYHGQVGEMPAKEEGDEVAPVVIVEEAAK